MAETRWQSEAYADVGMELVRTEECLEELRNSEAQVAFLASDASPSKAGAPTLGRCELVQSKNQWAIPYDYCVVVYEPNCEGMSEEQLRILLLHELMHVLIDHDKDGEEVYRVRPHDLEDFKLIIDRYGTEWAKV